MEFQSQGFITSVRPHGDASAVVSVLTPDKGRYCGYVKGAMAKKYRGVLDSGNAVEFRWFSRLEDNLGSMTVELIKPHASDYMDDAVKLSALQSICAMIDMCLPERENHPAVYEGMRVFIDHLDSDVWAETYVFLEMALLKELGFGLDLLACAATGQIDGTGNDQLAYISPKTGRAVSLSAGEPYKDKLLPLPPFLIGRASDDRKDILDGLEVMEYFFTHRVFSQTYQVMPDARLRFIQRFSKTIA